MAIATGLPAWGGLLVAGGMLFGVPLFAVHVVERFSPDWADRIIVWHMIGTGWLFVILLVVGVGAALWRWIAG